MNAVAAIRASDADDVDALVEALVAHPERADDVKALLRRKLAAPDVVRVLMPEKAITDTPKDIDDSEDDLWDNVPI